MASLQISHLAALAFYTDAWPNGGQARGTEVTHDGCNTK